MNKKIKVIELLNKIANGEEMPKEIKFENKIYKYYKERQDYIVYIDEDEFCGETLLFNIMSSHFIPELLETKVEILEDNIEEIEELNGSRFVLTPLDEEIIDRINKLVNATNKIRKDLNKC